eukprot:evm.model.scf_2018.3 EVM.evm.TU.scf_2018.3   scf_2018:14641-17033(-)
MTMGMPDEHSTSTSAGYGASQPPRPSAKTVADQFAHQFYKVLEKHPRYLHRFYDKASTLTISEAGEDGRDSVVVARDQEVCACACVLPSSGDRGRYAGAWKLGWAGAGTHAGGLICGAQEIHDRLMELFPEASVRLEAVCPQASVDEGILMLVMGELSRKGKPDCLFAQTLFLAVQNKGFFVLNDIIRLSPINRVRRSTSTASARLVNEAARLRRDGDKGDPERASCPDTPARQESPSSTTTAQPPPDRRVHKIAQVAQPATVQAAGAARPPQPAARPPNPDHPGRPRQPTASEPRKAGLHLGEAAAKQPQRTSSAFVRSIPESADAQAVADAFSQFGRLREGGLTIKQGRRDRFAFVELESVAALDRALAGVVRVNGQLLTVEEKRPMVIRRPGRVKRPLSGHSTAARDVPQGSATGYGAGPGSGRSFHHSQMAHHALQYTMQM